MKQSNTQNELRQKFLDQINKGDLEVNDDEIKNFEETLKKKKKFYNAYNDWLETPENITNLDAQEEIKLLKTLDKSEENLNEPQTDDELTTSDDEQNSEPKTESTNQATKPKTTQNSEKSKIITNQEKPSPSPRPVSFLRLIGNAIVNFFKGIFNRDNSGR